MIVYCIKKHNELTRKEKSESLQFVDEYGNIEEDINEGSIQNHLFVLAKDTTKLNKVVGIGSIDFKPYETRTTIPEFNINVREQYRRKGIGTNLIYTLFNRTQINRIRVFHTEYGQYFYKDLGTRSSTLNRKQFQAKLIRWRQKTKFVNPFSLRYISINTALRLSPIHPARQIAEVMVKHHSPKIS